MIKLLAVVVLASCSGRSKPPDADSPRATGSGATTGSAAVSEAHDRDQRGDADCEALLTHIVALDVQARPADQQLSAAEQAKLRDELRPQFAPRCRAMPRASYRCALAATTADAVAACD